MANKQNEYINQLIKEQEESKREVYKKAHNYLKKIKFYEKKLEEKVDYLLTENGLTLIEKLSSERMQLLEIANCLGITQKSLHEISRENPEIFDAIDRGRAKDYNEVEMALLKLATGYYKEEEVIESYQNERSIKPVIKKKIFKRWFQPNTYANIKYLETKKKEEYMKSQIELETAKNTIKIEFQIIGDDSVNKE